MELTRIFLCGAGTLYIERFRYQYCRGIGGIEAIIQKEQDHQACAVHSHGCHAQRVCCESSRGSRPQETVDESHLHAY